MQFSALQPLVAVQLSSYEARHDPNENGEAIDIKWDCEGAILIRHSDIDPKRFGKFHEISKRMRQPQVEAFLKAKGIDPGSAEAKQVSGMLGGYVVLDGKAYNVSPAETALILETVKQNGGIVPNWSNRE